MSTEAPTPDPTPAAAPPARTRGRFIALAAAFVLSALAVGGGAGALILATRTSPQAKPVAQKPYTEPPFGVRADGSHFGPLAELLLPVPASDTPGADESTLGDFTTLTPAQYSTAFLDEYRFLDAGRRSSLQSQIGLGGLKGYALRSYADADDGLGIRITLMQADPTRRDSVAQALRTLTGFTSGGGFRSGPSVSGYPHAHCYFPPNPFGSAPLDRLRCEDVEGDLLVTMQVDGISPIAQSAATDFFRQQLTRLATPAAQV